MADTRRRTIRRTRTAPAVQSCSLRRTGVAEVVLEPARSGAVINYDRFRINQEMYDAYAEMDRYFLAHYFANITRTRPAPFCAPSWAKRSRDATSHRIYSSAKEEAQAFLATLGRESEKEA
jgi:hypothetical protein